MGRILALDYGRKRTGIAVTDPLQLIAGGLTTVRSCDLLAFLLDYTSKEEVELIIIGLPRQMNGEASESMKYITPFVGQLKSKIKIRKTLILIHFASQIMHHVAP